MRYALYRLTAPILDRIPDISHQTKGRQMSIGFAASLLVHLLLLLVAAVIGLLLPETSILEFAKAKPKLQEIEITVLPVETSAPELVTPEELERRKQFMDSAGLAKTTEAAKDALFESDANMKAASQLPARGDAPLPTQEGRKDRAFPDFADQKMKLGEPAAAPAPPPPAVPAESKAEPAKTEPPAAPAPPADPTLKPVETKAPDEIAMSTRAEETPPLPVATPAPKIRMRASAPVALLTPPVPQAPPQPPSSTSTEEREKTQIDGNITNRGPNSVDAEGTPLGVYMKGVKAAIGSRWNGLVTGYGGSVLFPPGSIRVSFEVDQRGKIGNLKTTGNTSSSAYGFACEKAVRDAQLRPPRKGLFNELPNQKLEITYTFTIYGL